MYMSAMSLARNFYSAFKVSEKANLLGGMPRSEFSSLTGSNKQSIDDLKSLAKQFDSFNANKAKIRDQYKEMAKNKDFDIKDFFSHNANKLSDKTDTHINSAKLSPELEHVKKSANELKLAASEFMKSGEKSVFHKDSHGKMDTKTLEKAFNNYVSAYNNTVSSVSKSGNSDVMSKGVSMMNLSSVSKNELSKIGLSIKNDGKLELNTLTLSKAKEADLRKLADGKYSYMQRIQNSANKINDVVQGSKHKTYNNVASASFSMANTLGVGNFVNFSA